MDHRVSKDMISSGMTPSGKKTQADLGKTQYGSAPSPNRLMDAYHSMYQNQKEETLNEKMGDMEDFASRNIKGARGAAKVPTPPAAKAPAPTQKPNSMTDTVKARREKVVSDRREKVLGRMQKAREQGLTDGVDLLAAYQSIYADTFEEGKMPEGLKKYLEKKNGKDNGEENGDEEENGNGKDKKDDKKKDKKDMKEGAGLYANIHAKRKRGGKMRKKGEKGAPSSQDFANAARTAKEEVENLDEFVVSGTIAGLAAGAKALAGKALASGAAKTLASTAAKKGIGGAAKKGTMMVGKKLGGTQGAKIAAKGADAFGKMDNFSKLQAVSMAKDTVGSAVNKVGSVATAPFSAANKVVSGGISGVTKRNTTGTISAESADVDLFDILKGQLLDEGLTEQEVVEIMTTLTPEEIMNEMAVNPKIAAMDAKNKADMIARAKAKQVPQNVKDAAKRQYKAGTPRENPDKPYTTDDKKTIQNYYSKDK